ncbi:MAG: hypothetical protein ACJ70Z_09680 [Nitrososphaera sp.]
MSQDAVKVASDIYKVLIENDSVRVLEGQMKQGTKSEMHSHPRSIADSYLERPTTQVYLTKW